MLKLLLKYVLLQVRLMPHFSDAKLIRFSHLMLLPVSESTNARPFSTIKTARNVGQMSLVACRKGFQIVIVNYFSCVQKQLEQF